MQNIYLQDYDVNLRFPDDMSDSRIDEIITRDYPEPDEKLVARFENPDTPAASLSKEDHERYLQARPDMTAGRFAGMAADAFTSTAGRLLTNLPEFLKTLAMSPIEMGVSARTLAEGFARGTYDTETMGRMAEGYLMSKVEGFGGRTNDEKENQYRRFLKVKELQNVRSKIDKGDKSAWNEYMEWAGANGAKIDPEKFNQGAAEFLGEFADPSLLIPGSKIGTAIAKTTGRVTGGAVSAAGDMMSAGGRRLSDLRSSATDAVGNLASKVDEASGGIGRDAVPGGVGAAVGVGALDLGTAGMGTLAVAGIPAAMEVAGGLLRNFGDAMKVNPTRSGGLARMALNSPDTAAGYLAGKLQFLDTPVNYAGRAASGAVTGVGIGAGIGLATGGVEGLAQGIGSGGAMGAFGGTMGRFAEGATGAAKRAAQDSDLVTWLESKSDEDRASLGRYKNRDDLIRAMDLEQVILGSTSEAEPIIRYGTDETVIGQDAQGKDITLKGGGGAYTQEGGRPVIHLNTNSDLRTLAHETFHAIARIDGFEVMVQRIKDQVGKLYKDQEIDKLINDYEKSGKLLVTDDTPGKSDRDKKFNSILEEIGAEYFANYIKGKDSNYLFKGNPIREAIRGITDRFVAGKLDRVHNTFKSDIFDTPIKQSKALNRSIDDLVRARRRSKRNINLSVDTPVRVYSDFDLKDDAIFQELVDMGAARVTATGKREMIKSAAQVKKIEAERTRTMAKVLDSVDDTGGLIRDERGNYSGLRFSRQQIDALLASDAITGTLRKALEKIREMPDDSGLMNVLYAAATTKVKRGTRYRNLPLSNRDAILYNFIVSPETGTMRVKVADKTLLDQRVAKEFANPETQKEFSNIEEMQRDLLTYLDALSSGQTPTAEVLGSAKKRDILNKVLRVRNQKNNILVPEGTKFNEVEKNFPWRDFRLDRIVQMTTRETKVNFSEDAYNRAGINFSPEPTRPVEDHPENQPVQGRLSEPQAGRIDELQKHYEKVTPARIKALEKDAIDSLASRLMNLGIPVSDAKSLARESFKNIKSKVRGAMQVISGMGKSDLSRLAGVGRPSVKTRGKVNPNWLTSAFESFENDIDLALMKAQQVGGAESGVRQVTPEQGESFVTGERLADTKAFGSSLRDDEASPPRVYSSVVEGQKFGSQGNYNLFFEWNPKTPMVVTSHHHYGVANGITDIHASANVGDKNARSFGDPESETYTTLPSGKKVLDTPLLVGNKGASTARSHQLTVSTPTSGLNEVKKSYKKGGLSAARRELAKVISNEMIGKQSQGKAKSYASPEGVPMTVAIQRNRTEAYILNPDLANVKKVTIVSNDPSEVRIIKNNLKAAFKNNSSKMPTVQVVNKSSGESGNKGRKAITDEHYNLTGQTRFSPGSKQSESMPAFNVKNEAGSPFADMIAEGVKTIETRVRPSLNSIAGSRVKLIRTTGEGSGEVIGEVTVGEPKFYATKDEFDADFDKHLVKDDSEFAFGEQGKYGYPMLDPVKYQEPYSVDSVRDRPKGRVTTRDMPGPRFSPERMESLPSGEGPVLPKVEPPILQGPSANVVSLTKVKAEISKEKSPKVVDNTEIQEDMPVGLRLDIPTYERTIKAGQPVFPVAVHEKWKGKQAGKAGKVIGYTNIAAVKNPVFTVNEKAAESIKGGKAKSTIATVEGLYSKTREIPEDIDTWTQVGMNPRRHSYFYDRETGQPVIGGDVAISSGNTVFVKNPIYDSPGSFRFSPQRVLDSLGMYSKAQEAIEGMQQKRGTGQQFLKAMEKAGVKAEEIEDIGLDTFLKDNPRVNKEEVLDFIKANQIEMVEVTMEAKGVFRIEGVRRLAEKAFSSREDAESFWKKEASKEYEVTQIEDLPYIAKRDAIEMGNIRFPDTPVTEKKYVIVEDGNLLNEFADFKVFDDKDSANAEVESEVQKRFNSSSRIVEDNNDTKYSDYTEPGAETGTYTERLLTAPPPVENLMARYSELTKAFDKRSPTPEERAEYLKLERAIHGEDYKEFRFGLYHSSHFDETNIIAHVRHNDRIGPDGEKILFLEEIQSDWHQEGREKGYKTDDFRKLTDAERAELEEIENASRTSEEAWSEARRRRFNELSGIDEQYYRSEAQAAPNAPFKKSWPEFSMKRMLKLAADEGYDAIAWTRGETQNARYQLGDKVTGIDVIDYGDSNYELMVRMPNEDVFKTVETNISKEKLPDYIGKELTRRALSNMEGSGEGMRNAVLEGENLRLGGKGMRGFYDDKLPKLKVWKQTKDGNGNRLKPVSKMISDDLEANYVALNDSVKKKISSQGMPRYSPEVKLNKTRDLNKRGGAIYTNERGDRAVQTSLRAGIRIYSTQGKRIGPVFKSIEKAERHLAKMGK